MLAQNLRAEQFHCEGMFNFHGLCNCTSSILLIMYICPIPKVNQDCCDIVRFATLMKYTVFISIKCGIERYSSILSLLFYGRSLSCQWWTSMELFYVDLDRLWDSRWPWKRILRILCRKVLNVYIFGFWKSGSCPYRKACPFWVEFCVEQSSSL